MEAMTRYPNGLTIISDRLCENDALHDVNALADLVDQQSRVFIRVALFQFSKMPNISVLVEVTLTIIIPKIFSFSHLGCHGLLCHLYSNGDIYCCREESFSNKIVPFYCLSVSFLSWASLALLVPPFSNSSDELYWITCATFAVQTFSSKPDLNRQHR